MLLKISLSNTLDVLESSEMGMTWLLTCEQLFDL